MNDSTFAQLLGGSFFTVACYIICPIVRMLCKNIIVFVNQNIPNYVAFLKASKYIERDGMAANWYEVY